MPARSIGRVKGRSAFQALRTSRRRGSAGPVRITFVGGVEFDRPCLAFALNRKVGGAVQRNRLRRRLRAIAEEFAPQLAPGAYLIAASSEAVTLPYGELRANVSAAIAATMQQVRT